MQGMKLGHLYPVLLVDEKDFKDIGKEKPTPEQALAEKLDRVLMLDRPDFVDKVFDRNETTTRATLRILDRKKRRKLVSTNKEIVERVYSRTTIGRQIYDVITSP